LLLFLINLINDDDAFVSAVTGNMCSMVHLVCLFMKKHLIAFLQDNYLIGSLYCLVQSRW